MQHTVTAGETLSRIARQYGVTLGQLLDANPRYKPNPDRVFVGDLLVVPGGDPAPAPAAPVAPVAPKAAPAPEPAAAPPAPLAPLAPPAPWTLGKLSEQFETGGRGPGTVSTGIGDPGGVSYGSYQMTSKPGGGTVARFVAQPDFPFRAAFANLTPATAEFTAAWKQLAATRTVEFQAAQHEYIKRTHYDVLVKKILVENGVDVTTRSHAVQDAIWSTAVQHGPNSSIPGRALAAVKVPVTDPAFDRQFITAIYAERGKKNETGGLAYFSKSSPAVQAGVAKRFQQEQGKALAMLG
jgi:LysM repeat protein